MKYSTNVRILAARALDKAWPNEFEALEHGDKEKVISDFLRAEISASEYLGRIWSGNLQSYANTLRKDRKRQLGLADQWIAENNNAYQKAYTAGYDAAYFYHASWSKVVASPDYPSAERYRIAFRAGYEDGETYREQEHNV